MRMLRRMPTISPREAAERLSRGELQLVDVREAAELAAGAAPAATHIPLGGLQGELSRLDRRRPVAFVCRSGGRSAAATGAKIHVNRLAEPDYEHEPFDDGWELELGSVVVRALHTPGHRPEHTAFALIDTRAGPRRGRS
jgi:hypothetical protein